MYRAITIELLEKQKLVATPGFKVRERLLYVGDAAIPVEGVGDGEEIVHCVKVGQASQNGLVIQAEPEQTSSQKAVVLFLQPGRSPSCFSALYLKGANDDNLILSRVVGEFRHDFVTESLFFAPQGEQIEIPLKQEKADSYDEWTEKTGEFIFTFEGEEFRLRTRQLQDSAERQQAKTAAIEQARQDARQGKVEWL